MGDFKSCPVCREQSDQCLSCASYVVEGERIYYEKLKDFGATKDHEVRFINRIQKHCTTAFFHNGELYIPSRQGRSVPLAIGLQWNAWQEQQAIINDLKAQLECCRKENAVLLGKLGELQERIDTTKSSQSKLHKTEMGDCLHFNTTMFHEGKATCFECDAVVNHKRKVIGVMQTRTLRGEHD